MPDCPVNWWNTPESTRIGHLAEIFSSRAVMKQISAKDATPLTSDQTRKRSKYQACENSSLGSRRSISKPPEEHI